MSRHSLVWVVTLGIALALWALPSERARAEPPPEEDLSQGSWAPYPEDGTGATTGADGMEFEIDLGATGAFGTAGSEKCLYQTDGDWPHKSKSDIHVSAHGWWNDDSHYIGGECPERADVEVWIQAHYCGHWQCWWRTIAKKEYRVRAKNLANNRVTARALCYSEVPTGYRSIVDVDLVGQRDPPDKFYSIPINIECRPRNY